MTVWWCRGCGREDTVLVESCPTCSSAMQVAQLEWLEEDDEGDETVFEIETEPMERAAIVQALMGEEIRHRWEGITDLVVSEANEPAVDRILDDVLGADAEVEVVEFDQPGESEDGEDYDESQDGDYAVLTQLYDVSDRLQKRRDEGDVAEFLDTAGVALASPAPYGIEDEDWATIQADARNLSAALQEDAEAGVEEELKAFRDKLHALV